MDGSGASAGGVGVEARAVTLRYGDRDVLRAIDLHIAPGERVALLGPNGAGKSSLLRCVTGAVRPAVGTVLLDGVPLAELGPQRLARQVAVVPGAATVPFAMRVAEVVALGRIPHEHPFRGPGPVDHAAVAAAISRVGIDHLAERDARQLSLGERQLVALATALAQSPRLLILDEPTVHLDLRHQIDVMELLVDLNERDGVTVLAVLHALDLAAHFFARTVLLDDGRIVADGSPRDVVTAETLASVFRVDPRFVPALPL